MSKQVEKLPRFLFGVGETWNKRSGLFRTDQRIIFCKHPPRIRLSEDRSTKRLSQTKKERAPLEICAYRAEGCGVIPIQEERGNIYIQCIVGFSMRTVDLGTYCLSGGFCGRGAGPLSRVFLRYLYAVALDEIRG